MQGRVIMVQGTASHVGKSVLVSALCRIFKQDGYRVCPFKAQNMSNNSHVTPNGGEIGRAQAVQAEAAGVDSRVEMNPVLLKPEADHTSQVVLMGKPLRSAQALDYFGLKTQLWESVRSSLDILREEYDIVVIEGAGSPAEINLKANEIVNMRVAMYCNAPVLLCGDIDRGGVFASLIGTLELLEPEERDIIKGFIINKFRGDQNLLTDGLDWLENRTGIPVAGVIHHYNDIHIPEEDSVALDLPNRTQSESKLDIVVIQIPHISNFDDFDPLTRETGVGLRYVSNKDEIGDPDLIVLPGSKTTIPDLQWIEQQGLSELIISLNSSGTPVIGICGGYQMLGQELHDPKRIESNLTEYPGLGLLPISTTFEGTKETHRIQATVVKAEGLLTGALSAPITGYEIHMGRTSGIKTDQPFLIESREDDPELFQKTFDGAVNENGDVLGTYIHGLFHNVLLRQCILQQVANRRGIDITFSEQQLTMDQEYDKLADWVRSRIDMDLIYQMTGLDSSHDTLEEAI
ncbi:MAG: cobyric acid synthase [SAR202 cluster bacterium]|nr:MAG: cobyric acid synthase [SAR202 cluster bacterium]MBH39078.1 cobyric acid synthase CobQ [Chloroflexota bacterium]